MGASSGAFAGGGSIPVGGSLSGGGVPVGGVGGPYVGGGGDCCGGGSGAVLAGGRHSGAMMGTGMGTGTGVTLQANPGCGIGSGTSDTGCCMGGPESACGGVGSACFEGAGNMVSTTDWTYVGEGRGDYNRAGYNYVGEGA